MLNDPLADMLTRLRNALRMRHPQVIIPHSKWKALLAEILYQEGYLAGVTVAGEKTKRSLVVQLQYLPDGRPAISKLTRVSRLSRRVYAGVKALKPIRSGLGLRILSTSQGVMTDVQARAKKVGGEVLVEVW